MQGTLRVRDPFQAPLDSCSFEEDLEVLDKVDQEQGALAFPCLVGCWHLPGGLVLEDDEVAEDTHGDLAGLKMVDVGLQSTDFVPIDQVCCNHLVGCSSQIAPHVSLRMRT